VLFEKYSHIGSGKSLGLYYAWSLDGGTTWTDAEIVADSAVRWSRFLSVSDQSAYRLWQDEGGLLWQDHSTDAGQTWSREEVIPSLQSTSGVAAAAVDSYGRVHLILIAEDLQGNLVLNHVSQDGQGWHTEVSLYLTEAANTEVKTVEAATSESGMLGVVYVLSTLDTSTAAPENALYFVSRPLSPADVAPVATATQAADLPPTADPASPTPALPLATPTFDPAELAGLDGQSSATQGNQTMAIVLGASLAALLVIVGLGVNWIRRRGRG
jgi:hypothetical protein